MSNIVQYNQPNTNISEEIVKHFVKSQIIKNCEKKEVLTTILDSIQNAHKIKKVGVPSKESIDITAKYIYKIILEKFKYFTLFDILKAGEMGAFGLLKKEGDMNSISAEMFCNWLMRYQKKRNDIIATYLKDRTKRNLEAEKEAEKIGKLKMLENIIKAYNDYGFYDTIPLKNITVYCNKLYKFGLLKFPPEDVLGVYDKKANVKFKILHDCEISKEFISKYSSFSVKDIRNDFILKDVFNHWHKLGKKLKIENEILVLSNL